MFRSRWLVGILFASFFALSSIALAHHTGNERRTAAQCEGLPPGQRARCIRCVSLPRPHHYHPLQRLGSRCDPDNGRR